MMMRMRLSAWVKKTNYVVRTQKLKFGIEIQQQIN